MQTVETAAERWDSPKRKIQVSSVRRKENYMRKVLLMFSHRISLLLLMYTTFAVAVQWTSRAWSMTLILTKVDKDLSMESKFIEALSGFRVVGSNVQHGDNHPQGIPQEIQ